MNLLFFGDYVFSGLVILCTNHPKPPKNSPNCVCFCCPFTSPKWFREIHCVIQDTFDHDKGQKSAFSGRRPHWIFEFSPVEFFPFPPGSRPKMLRKLPDFGCRAEKKRRILSRLWLSWFFFRSRVANPFAVHGTSMATLTIWRLRGRLSPPLRAQILKKFKILKFSSEIEIFQASHPPTPYFLWGILKVEIENFKRD